MPLQYKFFSIPAKDSQATEAELNKFIRSVRVLNVFREFTCIDNSPIWCFSIEYLPGPSDRKDDGGKSGRSKIDYREVLAPEEFALFSKLREWRKVAAAKEGVPVYAVFTNEQLARVATNRISTKSGLLGLEGIGEAKTKKYGEGLLKIIQTYNNLPGDKNP